ncbi:OmpA family protein [Thiomicrorhabdus arctica]|jgi:OOP family OmpA-OmpF porin|uniref:OmpA family protein n=1 Tax=Thiomicrorhabdus arctica TaxID=131540 RepID=UPI0003791815|nr:OmpA family protein [Thiomicrorhabdus arctica]
MKKFQKTLITSILVMGSMASLPVTAKEEAKTQSTANYAAESLISLDANIVDTLYKDLDQDNVQDKLDHCPNTLIGVSVDKFGCELDTDQDGVFDRLDQCPDSLAGTPVNVFGCEGDADGDYILDSKDACPNTPEGATVNEQGCVPKSIVISNIVFNSAQHEIRSDQTGILLKDAAPLGDLKTGEVILITGHTDAQGDAEMNKRLSWRRANSAKNFIVTEFDINPDRIYISGKGEMEPVADNTTVLGRQENRRIQFKITPQTELPKSVSLTLPKEMKLR